MATLTIRNVEEPVKQKLRMAAALHGHSVEEEVRCILRQVLNKQPAQVGMGTRIHQLFAAIGGVELELPPRTDHVRIVDFGDGDDCP